MAFATSVVRVESTGQSWLTTGKWTGAIGDAAGTIKVPGQVVVFANFDNNVTSAGPADDPTVSWTSSGGVSTVTVANFNTVTNGWFVVISR